MELSRSLLPEPTQSPKERSGVDPAVCVAAGLSLLAAGVHLWAAPGHAVQWPGYGAFLFAVALLQGTLAALLLRGPSPSVALAGVPVNLLAVGVYLVTRTYGLPFGPHAGRTEEAGALDLVAVAAELGVVAVLVASLGGRARRWAVNGLLALGVALWILRLTGATG